MANGNQYEEIASLLNRSLVSVRDFIEKKLGLFLTDKIKIEKHAEFDLTSRPFWPDIKLQFNKAEQDLFLYHWSRYVGQFHNDVLPTEEIQILDLIKFDLLGSRSLRDQNAASEMLLRLEAEVTQLKNLPTDEQNVDRIFNLERQIGTIRASKDTQSRDVKDYQDKKIKLYEKLKATRDQRFKEIEAKGEEFPEIVNRILKDPAYCDSLSMIMEKMRVAAEVEKKRLYELHSFGGGDIDPIILNSESVNEEGMS